MSFTRLHALVAPNLTLERPTVVYKNVYLNIPLNTSAVAQQFLQCEDAHFIVELCKQYDRLNDIPFSFDATSSMHNLIFNNYKILYSNYSTNPNQLSFMEALHIKYLKPQLNSGLKASKELSLFN